MAVLSRKDDAFRNHALNGNLFSVLLTVGLPLALFNVLNSIFSIIDSFLASEVSSQAVSTVTYLNQLQGVFNQLGAGLAAGGSLMISRFYGAGEYDKVRRNVSTLLALAAILGGLFALIIPFSSTVLSLLKTPEVFISDGALYFNITMISSIISFFNAVYMAVERARGNTKRILYLNTTTIVFKLLLSRVLLSLVKEDLAMIALSSVVAQSLLFCVTFYMLFVRKDYFSFSFRHVAFNREIAIPMLSLSLPLVIEKSAFAIGKTIVNGMCTVYGTDVVGALGVSNNLNGVYNNAQSGMQDASASVISQNVGAGKYDRAVKSFWIVMLYDLVISIVGYVILMALIGSIAVLFSHGDEVFEHLLVEINAYAAVGGFSLFLCLSSTALLFGLGKTNLTLLINFCRLFLFRIPVLWYLENYTNFGYRSAGVVMLISNISTSLFAFIIALLTIRGLRKAGNIGR